MKITITHGFRGLLKPSRDQETLIIKTFGCCRKLWNLRLENILKDNPDYLSIPQYRQLYPYMKEVDSLALVGVERNQIQAFKNFKSDKSHFGLPKFKSKYAPIQSYTTCNQKSTVRFEGDSHIKLPKLGIVKCKMFSTLPTEYKLTFATISKESDGKYYISLTITYEKEIEDKPLDITMAIGLDYSLPKFYVDSNGNSPEYPHYYYVYQEKLAREQRKLSKMKKDSNHYKKQKLKVAKIHKKISNLRLNFCHQPSHFLSQQYDIICVEDINLQHHAEHKNWGKKTSDNGFGMFRAFLKYKLEEQGKLFIKIDKWFPSSKTCHYCGIINSELSIDDRTWRCPSCGEIIDRDLNAAVNILDMGLSMI